MYKYIIKMYVSVENRIVFIHVRFHIFFRNVLKAPYAKTLRF